MLYITDAIFGAGFGSLVGHSAHHLKQIKELEQNGVEAQTTLVSTRTYITRNKNSTTRHYCVTVRYDAMGPLKDDLRGEAGFIEQEFHCSSAVYSTYQAQPAGTIGPPVKHQSDRPEVAKIANDTGHRNRLQLMMAVFTICFVFFYGFNVYSRSTFSEEEGSFVSLETILPLILFFGMAILAYSGFYRKLGQSCGCVSYPRWYPHGTNPLPEANPSPSSVGVSVSPLNVQAATQAAQTYACTVCNAQFQAQSGTVVACPSCGSHNQV